MSSLSQALSIALSGLQTSTQLITLASNNIANAQTPGYTEKTANLQSLDFGGDSGGVGIASYGRASDQALTNNYNAATSSASYYGTQNNYMSQVQTLLGSTSTNPALSNDIANFSSAWSQYSSQPENAVAKQTLLSAGTQLASDIQSASSQVGALDSQIQGNTVTTVKSLNSDLQQVASLNQSIDLATTSGGQTGELLDQRDTLVNQISSIVGVSVQNRANGQIALYSTTGQLLVDSNVALQFSYDGTNVKDPTGANVTSGLVGGSLQAELDFRSTSTAATNSSTPGVGVIAKLQAQLSTLAGSFSNATGASNSPFANAYASAATASTAVGATQNGSTVDSNFFNVTYNGNGSADPSTFEVNPDLLNGTSEVPQTNTQAIANSFNTTANYTAPGLSATNVTYAQLGSAILSSFQQAANSISSQSTTASSQQSFYQTTLSSTTGVNIDNELANLVAYQNSYAASAHVISTINTMLTTLMSDF